ncbi:hypothetical protein ACO22_00162 [Paracoccidioides brasiliensis]|uniref:Deacetylase sirtuin-type domain-containing protein n=1 Tax=Paracoccidioides brasiliensis TaxID=121759 RepID=A0A1D2JQB6_PARBR|nr:hypothetical protein ACO22_00162 [Paracoccidioides brasiliensis]
MASPLRSTAVSETDRIAFSEYLRGSKNVMALLGAGLSAASGLPTFRGAGGLWRSHYVTSLATPEAFQSKPALVWQFYSYRRHMALKAQPNKAHFALAALAKRNPNFITLSQNVDGLSPRANHPASQLHLLHGSLFQVKCSSLLCKYVAEDYNDPIVPALAIPKAAPQPVPSATNKTGEEATKNLFSAMEWKGDLTPQRRWQQQQQQQQQQQNQRPLSSASKAEGAELNISDANVPIPSISGADLPKCPKCKNQLLRPGVVWFGESLPQQTINAVDDWIDHADKIDLILVIGTSAQVFPAAGYVEMAREKGARAAVINMDTNDEPPGGMLPGDWFFQGDASVIVPELLRDAIGEV